MGCAEGIRLFYVGDSEKRECLYHNFEIVSSGGVCVGRCFLKEGDENIIMTTGNVGYSVDEEHRGHGYASAALRELADAARECGIARLVICCFAENVASARSCENAGARFDAEISLCESDPSYAYGKRRIKRYFLDVPAKM